MRLAFGAERQLTISSIVKNCAHVSSTRDLLSVTHLFTVGNEPWLIEKFLFDLLVIPKPIGCNEYRKTFLIIFYFSARKIVKDALSVIRMQITANNKSLRLAIMPKQITRSIHLVRSRL
jgi:hypothetical protein